MSGVLGILVLVLGAAAALSALRPRLAYVASASAAAGAAALLAWAWARGGGVLLDAPWLPVLGSRARLELDALSAPLSTFTAAIAAPILAYSRGYLPRHLAGQGRPRDEGGSFCRRMLGFLAAMLLLLLARDLLVMFAALELTALASFLLIEFDRQEREARRAATLALVLTGGSSLAFLAGALWIGRVAGTTELGALDPALVPAPAAWLLALGVLAKSAQFPLHVWLPRAMVAPTPVSAFLHSAALVAAGAFVLARLFPWIGAAPGLADALLAIGFASIALGGVLALAADELKRLLAYSTIAQLGYVLVLLGSGGDEGLAGAPFVLLAHGIAKAALFLTAGAVSSATGAKRLSQSGGEARHMPLLAGASLVAAAALAGVPATIGWFKDELLFAATRERHTLAAAGAVLAAAMTIAYSGRFWLGIFAGGRAQGRQGRAPGAALVWPVVLLALLAITGGLWSAPLEHAFARAGHEVAGHPVELHLSYRIASAESAMALAAFALGGLLLATRARWHAPLARATQAAARAGPAAAERALAAGTRRASHALYHLELRDLRDRLAAVVLPTALLVGLGIHAQGLSGGTLAWPRASELPLAAALLVAAGAALGTLRARDHLTVALLVSFVGYSLALAFALGAAPDVALVLVIVETLLTLVFLALLSRMRPEVLAASQASQRTPRHVLLASLATGVAAAVATWTVIGRSGGGRETQRLLELTAEVHAKDAVTAVLADFRGLDTVGEVTVLAVTVLGAATIRWGMRR